MDQASQRDLKILTEIAAGQDITQRGLSKSLGIALGLTNLYLACAWADARVATLAEAVDVILARLRS